MSERKELQEGGEEGETRKRKGRSNKKGEMKEKQEGENEGETRRRKGWRNKKE